MNKQPVKLIECPRDAMQGWPRFIPTNQKADYINALLKVGFDTIDFGSFVSPKAIPQMADTRDVLANLRLDGITTKLLAIIANERGAQDAVAYDEIRYLGFPFSVSETFQQRNTNSSIEQSLGRVEAIQNLCVKNDKQLVVYISMGFGNPYGDLYNEEIVFRWANKLAGMGIGILSLADTVGLATPEQVLHITKHLVGALPGTEIGVHLHSTPANWKEKLEAAIEAGCRRFDGALKGIGGCPMADDELVGNMDTERMIPYLEEKGMAPELDKNALRNCGRIATALFI
ncbi:MAG TPA: hydroxymethylglutaryl-CoA lyase [Ferruginibacter sp.]|nr:hydroxymethylglutaryl-CoA lyase [Chitinophagales bacterium]HNJ27905.1 hydroxymethylglutaryl-CoA lyase [Ferruginibacter sp.]HNJ93930.1 hydroxymethylglutaryl-CoA lyase [Ferruginibacter sp.]HNL65860.1 hydroxymethylglutaryl-CoA lyase [Ferruginibacter sp.]